MVLAYKDPEVENEHYEDTKSVDVDTLNDEESPDEKEEKRKHEREIFEKNLEEAGLELELEPSQVKLLFIISYAQQNLAITTLKIRCLSISNTILPIFRDLVIKEQTF